MHGLFMIAAAVCLTLILVLAAFNSIAFLRLLFVWRQSSEDKRCVLHWDYVYASTIRTRVSLILFAALILISLPQQESRAIPVAIIYVLACLVGVAFAKRLAEHSVWLVRVFAGEQPRRETP